MPGLPRGASASLQSLKADTGNRVKQQLVDAETGEVVARDRIAKGYEYSCGQYVTVDDEELKALQIETSKIIHLTQCVGAR